MSSLITRGNKLYAKIQDVTGTWRQLATGLDVGQEDAAWKWIHDREQEVANLVAVAPGGPLTVRGYALSWLDKRKTATVRDDRNRIVKHVLPRIGDMLMIDVRPRHLRDLIVDLKTEGRLAPKTIREVSGILHSMFKGAVIDEVIPANPVVFARGVLPKKVDKDPTWRHQAIYTRNEIEQIISDERIPSDRRVLYALKFFTGRHGEVAVLKWSQYDSAAKPLGALNLGKTKNGVPRAVPVHPTLAKILAAWKLSGWEHHYGRKPTDADMIAPTRQLRTRSASEAQKQLVADLLKLGLRVKAGEKRRRRGHDMRRTLITLARTDGAIDSMLRFITHGPKPNEMLDVYSSPPWESLCAELGKLKVSLREGKVMAMVAGMPNEIRGAVLVQSRKTGARGGLDRVKERPQRDSNAFLGVVDDTGSQGSQSVTTARQSPNDTGSGPTAPNRGAVLAPCDGLFRLLVAVALVLLAACTDNDKPPAEPTCADLGCTGLLLCSSKDSCTCDGQTCCPAATDAGVCPSPPPQ